jgi:hypothetical protein
MPVISPAGLDIEQQLQTSEGIVQQLTCCGICGVVLEVTEGFVGGQRQTIISEGCEHQRRRRYAPRPEQGLDG